MCTCMHTRRRNQMATRAKTEWWALDDALQGHDKKLRILVLIQRAMRTAQGRQSGAWGSGEAPWWGLICGDQTKRKLPREADLLGPWLRQAGKRDADGREARPCRTGQALSMQLGKDHQPLKTNTYKALLNTVGSARQWRWWPNRK